MWHIWLIIAGVCLIIEVITVGFLIFWLAIGALFAMVVSLIIQTSVFVISSALLIFVTKPFVKKFVNNRNTIKTNVYSSVGKKGIVTKDINSIDSTGQIKVDGELWSATGFENMNIKQGTEVEIKEIKGVKAIVAPIEK